MINISLTDVKNALGITGDYQNATLQIYFDEVVAFLRDAGVAETQITSGIVARGVSDLWNYGSGEGKLSQYFVQRAIQLSKSGGTANSSGGGGGDLSNYYTKMEVDALLLLKANAEDVYTKTAIDDFLSEKADKSTTYTKIETDNLLNDKANNDDVYSKSILDILLGTKANTDDVDRSLALKQDITDISLNTNNKQIPNAINEVFTVAKGAQKGVSYGNYETMITALNALSKDVYNIGQSIYIVSLNVPDLWVSNVDGSYVTYTYTTDEAFITDLNTYGMVQVGYYMLSQLETQKVDLDNYVDLTSNQDISASKKMVDGAALYFVNAGSSAVIYCSNDAYNIVFRSDNQNISFRCAQIIPFGNGTASLGSGSYKWKNLYLAGDIHCDNDMYLDGTLYVPYLSNGVGLVIDIDQIALRPIQGATAPTTTTAADYLGQEYIDTTSGDMYRCTVITPQGTNPETYSYTWRQLAFV